MEGKYGHIIVQSYGDLFDTIKHAQVDFNSISNVSVLFNDSLVVPAISRGVIIDLPIEIWNGYFDRQSGETGIEKLTTQEMNEKLKNYANVYVINNEKEDIAQEQSYTR